MSECKYCNTQTGFKAYEPFEYEGQPYIREITCCPTCFEERRD